VKICKFCGSELPADALTCSHCKSYKGVVEADDRQCFICGRSKGIKLRTVRDPSDGGTAYVCADPVGCRTAVTAGQTRWP